MTAYDDVDALVEVTAAGVGVDGVRVPGLLLDEVKVIGPDESGLWMTAVTILSTSRPAVDVGAELVRHEPAHEILSGDNTVDMSVEVGQATDRDQLEAAGWTFRHVPAVTTYRSRRHYGPEGRE
ncbi:hypothetical protein ACH47B_06615 [Rhodococcus sp. NPDC019627]|uniref:hypothetical protein n=1 Tax=unclassified Rhodococcus (in: high G+C Gram-positive bacteria) TaxID=192944 RepID=UPI0037B909BB